MEEKNINQDSNEEDNPFQFPDTQIKIDISSSK